LEEFPNLTVGPFGRALERWSEDAEEDAGGAVPLRAFYESPLFDDLRRRFIARRPEQRCGRE
jgi:hypothetical protein